MKKRYSASLVTAMALSICSFAAIADEMTPEKREAVHECMENAGIEKPGHGERPNDEQRAAADKCFTDNGVEPPRKRFNAE